MTRSSWRAPVFVVCAALVVASFSALSVQVDADAARADTCFTGGTPAGDPWTVPAGVHSVRLTVHGNRGGDWRGIDVNGNESVRHTGGRGSTLVVDLDVNPGDVLRAGTVGGGNGGDSPGVQSGFFQYSNAGGTYNGVLDDAGDGGAAQFVTKVIGGCPQVVAIAGGGGGAGSYGGGGNGGAGDVGSGAGWGGDGGSNDSDDGSGGGPGSTGAGGAAGSRGTDSLSLCHDGNNGSPGGFMSGGNGAAGAQPIITPSQLVTCAGGGGAGGGGAGYFGGGGGASGFNSNPSGGGGGGDSYVAASGHVVSQSAWPATIPYYYSFPGPVIAPHYTSTTTISSSPNPSTFGSAVTITARVTTSSASGLAPGGVVTFYDGIATLGEANVSNGIAKLTTSLLPQGTADLQAFFNGYDGSEVDAPKFTEATEVGGLMLPYQHVVGPPPPAPSPPVITGSPDNLTTGYGDGCVFDLNGLIGCGEHANFYATATGVPTPSLQWQYLAGGVWTNIAGGEAGWLSLRPTVAQSGQYRGLFTNGSGSVATAAATLVVNPASFIISADAKTMTYGDSAPGFTVTYGKPSYGAILRNGDTLASALTGTVTCNSTQSIGPATSAGTYTITCAGATAANYTVTYETAQLTIARRTQAVAISADVSAGPHSVGTVIHLSATSGASGNAVVYTRDASTPSGVCTVVGSTVTLTGYGGSGDCIVNANQLGTVNYFAAPQAQWTQHVLKQPQTILFTAPSPITFTDSPLLTAAGGGSGNPVTFSTGSGFQSCVVDATNHVVTYNVGPCTIIADQAGDANYEPASVSQTITVLKRSQALSWDPGALTRYVGEALQLFGYAGVSGQPVTFTIDPTSTAGSCHLSSGFLWMDEGGQCIINADEAGDIVHFPAPRVTATYTVIRPVLTVTASDAGMNYGGSVPTITPSYTGFISGANAGTLTAPATCQPNVTAASNAGNYASTCSGVVFPNYAIHYVTGIVTVSQKTVTVTASDAVASYGGAVTITPSYSGFLPTQNASVLTAAPTCGATVPLVPPSAVSSCSGAAALNYDFSYVSGIVTVGKAPLTVSAPSSTIVYGDALPSLQADYSGFLLGDTADDISEPTCVTTATATSGVGTYPTTCSLGVSANYDLSYVAGTLTITAAPVVVTASSSATTYGDAVPAVTPGYGGLQHGDTAPASVAHCSTTATSTSSVGGYPTVCSGAADSNYTFSYVDGVASITTAHLVVTAVGGTSIYAQAIPAITPSFSGLVGGDLGPSTPPVCTTTATGTSPVGDYPATCSAAADADYTISYVAGTSSVTPANLTVTASSGSFVRGAAVPAVSPSYVGFVNGDSASSLLVLPLCTTSATSTSAVGLYQSTCLGTVTDNYLVHYAAGVMSILPAPVVVDSETGASPDGTSPDEVNPEVDETDEPDPTTSPAPPATAGGQPDPVTQNVSTLVAFGGGAVLLLVLLIAGFTIVLRRRP